MKNTLNRAFYCSCKPNFNKISKINDDIFTIKDFFVDFDASKKFLNNLNSWECDHYDFTTKSGMESILPRLSGMYIYDNCILKKTLKNFILHSIDVNFLYYGQKKKFDKLQSSNGTLDFPHHDTIDSSNISKTYVLLVNLNDYPISTNFWTFNGKSLMKDNSYHNFIDEMNSRFIKDKSLTIPENLKLDFKVTYDKNQSIIYNAGLLHNADIEKKYTYSFPRSTLRIFFSSDIIKNNSNLNYN